MLRLLFILGLGLAAPAAAQTDLPLSDRIARDGLGVTEAHLASIASPDDADLFALGAVRFLRSIERALQARYRGNLGLSNLGLDLLPVLRLPIPPNPDPEPFDAGMVADIFDGVRRDMETARDALAGIGETSDYGLEIDLTDLWFDVDSDGQRSPVEGVLEIVTGILRRAPDSLLGEGLLVRFDAADAAWLAAYTHLLSGFSELVLAFDPTDVVAEIVASTETMQRIQSDAPSYRFGFSDDDEGYIDLLAMVYGALNRVPDAAHSQAARRHFLAMVAENRTFWGRVAQETDDTREWLPNATQTAALGFGLPPDTGHTWLSVLEDAEDVLNGDLLVYHWRVAPSLGVNVARLMDDPPAVDIVTWLQGSALLPFFEEGPLVTRDSLRRFEAMFAGDAILFMVFLN